MSLLKFLLAVVLPPVMLGLAGCVDPNSLDTSTEKDLTEASLSYFSGLMDSVDESGEWTNLSGSSCTRVGTCSTDTGTPPTGTSTVEFGECTDSEGNYIEGETSVRYTVNPIDATTPGTPDCNFDIGETATVEHEMAVVSYLGGFFQQSARYLPNYETTTIGGGSYLTRLDTNSYLLTVSGALIRRNVRNGSPDYEVSLQSPSDQNLSFTGLARSGRSGSGQISFWHNSDQRKGTATFSGLSWEDDCCWPTSGTIEFDFSDSTGGSSTVEITGCGKISVNGSEETLRNCG
jgi:hypothetical protein